MLHFKNLQLLLLIALVILVNSAKVAKKSALTIAKSKKDSKKVIWKSVLGSGLVGRIVREAKTAFCSELEALTIQMTRPDDSATPTTSYAMLATCLNQDYEDAEFVTSVISKLSRKFKEINVHTKLKSLLCLQAVFQKLNDDARYTVGDCITSLKTEIDPKTNVRYFLNNISPKLANNAVELEIVNLLKEYYPYIFHSVDLKGGKLSKLSNSVSSIDKKLKAYCKFLSLSDKVIQICKNAKINKNSPMFKQLRDFVEKDSEWAEKQLQKLLDVSNF